jgi:hypothetical protein
MGVSDTSLFYCKVTDKLTITCKGKKSDLNVHYERDKRVNYNHKVDDLILLEQGTLQCKLVLKHDRPYQVIRLYSLTSVDALMHSVL